MRYLRPKIGRTHRHRRPVTPNAWARVAADRRPSPVRSDAVERLTMFERNNSRGHGLPIARHVAMGMGLPIAMILPIVSAITSVFEH